MRRLDLRLLGDQGDRRGGTGGSMTTKVRSLKRAIAENTRLRDQVGELCHLVGCAIEALEYFDSDDGHAELIKCGIVAEYRRIRKDEEA